MLIPSPDHVVLGSPRPDHLASFLEPLGFERGPTTPVARTVAEGLYGHAEALEEVELRMPGSEAGWIRIVRSPEPAHGYGPYEPRPVAFDLYTRDIDRSREVAAAVGGRCGELVAYRVGALEVRETEVTGPDGVVVVLLEASRRRPSLLDRDQGLLHSEVHSVVWLVPAMEEALVPWRDEAGLEVLVDTEIGGDVLSRLMALPEPRVRARFVLLADTGATPCRLELLELLGRPEPVRARRPLEAGLHAFAFLVGDLEAARHRLSSCTLGPTVEVASASRRRSRAVSGMAPGGVRFELWQRH